MIRVAAVSAFLVAASPSLAEDTPVPGPQEQGLSLMERGAQLLLEGLMQEMEPALDSLQDFGPALQGFAQQMGPALADLLDKVEDWSAYHPPEILDNGDIILRRKTPDEQSEDAAQDSEPVDI